MVQSSWKKELAVLAFINMILQYLKFSDFIGIKNVLYSFFSITSWFG